MRSLKSTVTVATIATSSAMERRFSANDRKFRRLKDIEKGLDFVKFLRELPDDRDVIPDVASLERNGRQKSILHQQNHARNDGRTIITSTSDQQQFLFNHPAAAAAAGNNTTQGHYFLQQPTINTDSLQKIKPTPVDFSKSTKKMKTTRWTSTNLSNYDRPEYEVSLLDGSKTVPSKRFPLLDPDLNRKRPTALNRTIGRTSTTTVSNASSNRLTEGRMISLSWDPSFFDRHHHHRHHHSSSSNPFDELIIKQKGGQVERESTELLLRRVSALLANRKN